MPYETIKIQEFIRDVTSVYPRPKSEVKRRLNEILESETQKAIEDFATRIVPKLNDKWRKRWKPQ